MFGFPRAIPQRLPMSQPPNEQLENEREYSETDRLNSADAGESSRQPP